jgi:hypothetical protein
LNNEKDGQGTHCTKMDADSLAKNTPNAPEFVCPSPKGLDFNEKKASLGVHSPSAFQECSRISQSLRGS